MARLTVRMPDSLHEIIAQRAQNEGVSLNQFIVYALTQATSIDILREQRAQFDALRNRFTKEEKEAALAEMLATREPG